MQTKTRGIRRIGMGAVAIVLAGINFGADGPTQSVDAGGLTFQAPSAWKSSKPSSQMRRAEMKIPQVEGDGEPAELVVFAFPGGAGSVDANVKRWQSMFKDGDGNLPKIDSKTVKGKNVDVTRVETAGHYFPAQFPGRPKEKDRPNYRLLGAIVQTGDTGFYLRMVGPDKTMQAARSDFDLLLASMNAGNP